MKKLILFLCSITLAVCAICASADELVFHPLDNFPLYGTLAPDAEKKYSRLPDSLKTQVREELWSLGLHSAGLSIRFATDASKISARWTSLNKFNMNHMTPAGIRGLDLYVMQDDSTWTTVCSARPSLSKRTSTSSLVSDMEPKMREYMLFLSLYDGVDSIFIGVDSTAMLSMPRVDLPVRRRPVVMYGTSILQGGCATRPGMAHTNILQRELNREVINLGFSGNARLDTEIAELMATADASLFVIDCLPNIANAEVLTEKIRPFYEIIRAAHPDTPILLVESPIFPIMRFNHETNETITKKNAAYRDFYESVVAEGDKNVHYFFAKDILGDDVEATVDNYHFTDTGFRRFASALLPVITELIGED